MAQQDREAAKQLIQELRSLKGGMTDSDLELLMSTAPHLVPTIGHLREIAGNSTEALAHDVYSSEARFVFELIQNAEDCKYTYAQDQRTSPWLRFTVRPDEIIISSNENGFDEDNVRAMCNMANSSKRNTPGYIGQKGIGFKSVFRIARKVHIQSGPYSFAFDCSRSGEPDRLAMTTPMDEEHHELPHGVRTQIRLTKLYDCRTGQQMSITREQCNLLFDIGGQFLMFLSKLKRFEVHRELAGEISCTTYEFSMKGEFAHITRTDLNNSTKHDVESRFRIFKKTVSELPKGPERAHTNTADIVLAFPIDEGDKPIHDQQYVFAFLPLQPAGFRFLIQSDFIAQAGREGVSDCPWNQQLRYHVAEAFCEAVSEFCRNEILVYQWLAYLPESTVSDSFWKHLRRMILCRLADMRIIRSWANELYQPGQMRILKDKHLDQFGDPLFPDKQERSIYPSPKYSRDHLITLETLGVKHVSWNELLERCIKGSEKNQNWHTRAANLLSELYDAEDAAKLELRRMTIVPLENGDWTCANRSPIYFQCRGMIKIPGDLGFNLVSPTASSNSARSHLFQLLGVTRCPPEEVVSKIFSKYHHSNDWQLQHHVTHLRYLFEHLVEAGTACGDRILVADEREIYFLLRNATPVARMYLLTAKDTSPYGLEAILGHHRTALHSNLISFIHPSIVENAPSIATHGKTFVDWLEETFGIVRIPQLVHHRGELLSVEFSKVIKSTPEKLVYVLREHWSHYKSLTRISRIREALQNAKVPVGTGSARLPLCQTYLPLPMLMNIVTGAGLDISSEFLLMQDRLCDMDANRWNFLGELGVGVRDDCRFYLQTLVRMANNSTITDWSSVLGVYEKIAERCVSEGDRELVRTAFSKISPIFGRRIVRMICIPSHTEPKSLQWFSLNDCVWYGPEWLTVKQPLNRDYASLQGLFRGLLKIQEDCRWTDFIEELKSMKRNEVSDHWKASKIYCKLMDDFRDHQSSLEELCSELNENELVAIPYEKIWRPLSSCIWAEPGVSVPGKHSIAAYGTDLAQFFTKRLLVPCPDLRMHVEALRGLATVKVIDRKWEDQVKDTMMQISALNPDPKDVSILRTQRIFLVRPRQRDKHTKWPRRCSETAFAINDRYDLCELFPEIAVLDFSVEESHKCRNLLVALGLADRFMSIMIKEETMVEGDSVFSSSLTNSLRLRAFALFRCAVHYGDTKLYHNQSTNFDAKGHSLFRQLANVEVYTSETMYKSLNIRQHPVPSEYRQEAFFHLDESTEKLRLYVPKRFRDRELCYLREMPRKLMQYLSISDSQAKTIICGIVKSSSLFVASEILKEAGIIEVPGIECPDDANEEDEQRTAGAEFNPLENVSADGPAISVGSSPTYSRATTPFSSVSTEAYAVARTVEDAQRAARAALNSLEYISADGPATSVENSSANNRTTTPFFSVPNEGSIVARTMPVPTPSDIPPTASTYLRPVSLNTPILMPAAASESTGYQRLLDRVIRSAAQITVPKADELAHSNHIEANDRIFNHRSFSRDVQVGAAGELFVYEILSGIGLPDFDYNVWQSKIRHHVDVHNDYKFLDKWIGTWETSDIVYLDKLGKLADFLVRRGYSSIPQGSQPLFHIEVKTTTLDWDGVLHVSKRQHSLMKECHTSTQSDKPHKVYILMRVFNLEFGSLGLRLYVDPITAKEKGELEFVEEGWKVKPR